MASLSQGSRPNPEHIFNVLNSYQHAAALKSAIELDVFTTIDEGNQRAQQIAERVKASERGVRILCDFLTILGFLVKEDSRYSLTADAELFLSRRSPAYMGTIVGFLGNERHLANISRLTEAVRRGGTVGETGHNREPDDALWVSFARSMAPLTVPNAIFIASLVNAAEGKPCRVLDIAAGHGMYGITIAQQNPKAEITALDWPAVLEVAKENAQKAGVGERYTTRPGSAFEAELGIDYDVALLTNIFHHFDRETCVQLMQRVHEALKANGKAVTLEFVPNEDRVSPPTAAGFSLLMLVGTDAGDAYTFSEYQKMFRRAGFPRTTLHPVPEGAEQVLISEKGR
ncbi:MAG TPA: methyltransferase [Candidatus Sulfotelmatobacter sp.]|nr:methyltransferase [Candidatus Sulfotelmatobacter sp.]